MNHLIIQPIVNYGFLGLAAVQMVVIVWLIMRLLTILADNNQVIAGNTEVINRLAGKTDDLLTINRSLHDKIISRPCIAIQE